jgi:hypothetical protein
LFIEPGSEALGLLFLITVLNGTWHSHILEQKEKKMSMQALNQLVARSIVEPNIVKAFASTQIGEMIGNFEFSPELRKRLAGLEAGTFAEFAMLAYRVVKSAEVPVRRIELPSPVEGLLDDQSRSDSEQVA